MRTIIAQALITLLLFSNCGNFDPIDGYWVGTMEVNGKTVDLSLNTNSGKSSFTCNDMMLLDIPLTSLNYKNGTVLFTYNVYDANLTFEGKLEKNRINGKMTISGIPPDINMSFNLVKKSDMPPAKPYSIEKIIVENKGINLSAEIYKPDTDIKHPALLLLPGSDQGLKVDLAFYADNFVKQGFEVMIYDKRGWGESTGNNITATYEELAEDAKVCLEKLYNRKTVDKGKIGLWGISQGGMLLPFISSKTEIPSFMIAIAAETHGPHMAAAFADSIRIINFNNSSAEGHIAAESHRKVARMIRDGKSIKEVEDFIKGNALQYNFMNQTGLYGNISINAENYKGVYWSGRKFDFYPFWEKLNIKALCIYGEDDDLVDPKANVGIIKSLGNKKIDIKVFSDANHVLKKPFNPRKNKEFDWPRTVPGYLEFVKEWLQKKIINN